MTLEEAREWLAKDQSKSTESETPDKPKKLTLDERKQELAEKITAAGGDVPAKSASIAKFNEALTAAETPKEDGEESSLY
jgi:hypothetical protein